VRPGVRQYDGGVAAQPPDRPGVEELARRWQSAEERLYPIVMVRPEAYEAALVLVRAVVDALAEVVGVEELAGRYEEDSARLVADAVRETVVSTEGLDLGVIAGAAFNIRYRDLRAAAQREQAKQRIRAAVRAGEQWVVLFETGRTEFAPLSPYRRLEMRVADGRGVHASIVPDPSTGDPVYAVEIVQLDPSTGDWVNDAEAPAGQATYPSRSEWDRALADLRGGEPPPVRS
jgi:hypothetical protein